MNREALAGLLGELSADLAVLSHPWRLIGSAALMVAGVDWPSCDDVDILTTTDGAEALEGLWSTRRDRIVQPDKSATFRSRFSRYQFDQGWVEVMGDLQVRTVERWILLDPGPIHIHDFGLGRWPAPGLDDQRRILQTFGRPKDLEKMAMLDGVISLRSR